MKQEDALSRLRVDLSDTTKAVFTEDVLIRAVEKATSDLSRFLPLPKFSEYTLGFTVSAEAWTSAAAAGTYVALANNPIEPESETVLNNAGTTMTRDTDYTIKYREGKITHISGGDIGNAESCTISYTKSKLHLDISDIYSDMMRLERVEYPLGNVPQTFISYEQFKDILMLKPGEYDTQYQMTSGKHILLYYLGKHTSPTDDAEATYPNFLDDTVILVSSAYALFTLCVKYELQAATDFTTARTKLDSIAAIHTLTNTALGKVTTYVTDMDTALDAAITQNEAAATALSKINSDATRTYLTDADTALDAAIAALESGATAAAKVDTYIAGGTESSKALLAQIATDIAELRTGYKTAIDAANLALDGFDVGVGSAVETAFAAITTALDKVSVYLTDNINEDTEYWLTKITTDISDLRTAAITALDAANSALDDVSTKDLDAATTGAIGYLEAGDAFINTVNTGDRVAEKYNEYSAGMANIANARVSQASAYLQEANLRLGNFNTYIEQAKGWGSIASGFVAEATQRVSTAMGLVNVERVKLEEGSAYIAEANQRLNHLKGYIEQANAYGYIASGFTEEAKVRVSAAIGYIQEASQRIAIADRYLSQASGHTASANGYIQEANGRRSMTQAFIDEANSRTYEIDRYLGEADRYISIANHNIELANAVRTEAIEKRNEGWTIWRNPNQYADLQSVSTVRQPTQS